LHKFLRAAGFGKLKGNKGYHDIIMNILENATRRNYASNSNETILAEFCKDFTEHIGIAVCGEFDEEDKFTYEYSYPYLIGSTISSVEDISVEGHADKESYAGVCDDPKIGVSLVFYLQNMIPYVRIKTNNLLPIKGTTLTLSALSVSGTILLPIRKNQDDIARIQKDTQNRSHLIAQARKGNEDAIETLTLEDMDLYNAISKKIQKDDLLSLVDTYFMPYGVECDQYSVLGEITASYSEINQLTGEEIYIMTILCNELTFDVCINKIDLYGMPEVGRRFKGVVWLQGFINFPEIYGV